MHETAARIAGDCAAVLGDSVRSVVLHGSLVTGGFRPGDSDIDLLVVVTRKPTRDEVSALVSTVRDADPAPADGIDLHVVAADVAAAPIREPRLVLHVGRYADEALEVSTNIVEPDLVTELAMARLGRALVGADPRDVIAEIPSGWITERSRHWLDFWAGQTDDADSAAFMVLTACRMWHTAITGEFCSKQQAGRWALDRDPSLAAIGLALRQLNGDESAVIDEAGIRAVLAAATAGLA